MALEDFLFTGERVRYKCPIAVEMDRRSYELYVTDQRLILYKHRGLLFKRDDFVDERIGDIRSMDYREKGAIFTKATVVLDTLQKSLTIAFKGSPEACKAAYQELQQHLKLERAEPAPRPAPEPAPRPAPEPTTAVAGEIPRVEAPTEYAGFWIRFLASIVDDILLSWVSGPLNIIYFIGLWAWLGQTIGMVVTHLKVVRTDGRPVDLGTAVLRFVGYIVCVLTLGIGFLLIAFDERKQGLHDKIAKTYVIPFRKE